jgi:hypothetical protein
MLTIKTGLEREKGRKKSKKSLGAQGRIYSFLVGKVRRGMRRKQNEIRSRSVPRKILASDFACQL